MAIVPRVENFLQPQPFIPLDTSLKDPNLELQNNQTHSISFAKQSFKRHFQRIHKKYKNINITNIQNLSSKLLLQNDPKQLKYVREETSLRDTFFNRIFKIKTPLGEVLQELQYSQESPNRKLLPLSTIEKAEQEAKKLLLKINSFSKVDQSKLSSPTVAKEDFSKIGPEFQINNLYLGPQDISSLIRTKDGFMVFYTSPDPDLYSYLALYAKNYYSNGTVKTNEYRVSSYEFILYGFETTASAAVLDNNKIAVSWEGSIDPLALEPEKIFSIILDENGGKNHLEVIVSSRAEDFDVRPLIINIGDNRFLVIWQRISSPRGTGTFGQIMDQSRGKIGSNIKLSPNHGSFKHNNHRVASLGNNSFVQVMECFKKTINTGFDICYQIFNFNGTNTTDLLTAASEPQDELSPTVVVLPNKEFVIAWQSSLPNNTKKTFAQKFSSDGSKIGIHFAISKFLDITEWSPFLTNFNDKFICTWYQYSEEDIYGVFAKIFNADCSHDSHEILVTNYPSYQQNPLATQITEGSVVFAWDSADQDGSNRGVFGQRFGSAEISAAPKINSIFSSSIKYLKKVFSFYLAIDK